MKYSNQVCWRQVNLQDLRLQQEAEDDEFDGFRMWKWQDLDTDLIWSEKDMMKPRLRAEELTGMTDLFNSCRIIVLHID